MACGKPTPAAGRARGSAGCASTARYLSALGARTRSTGWPSWTGAPGARACTWSSGWARSSAGTAARSWRRRIPRTRITPGPGAGRGTGGSGWPAGLGDAGLQEAGPAGSDRSPDLSEEVARALDRVLGRSLVSQSIQRAPDPEGKAGPGSGCRFGCRCGWPVRGGIARPGPRPGITRRLIPGRNATARPGPGWPAGVMTAWMRSGLVRSLGERGLAGP